MIGEEMRNNSTTYITAQQWGVRQRRLLKKIKRIASGGKRMKRDVTFIDRFSMKRSVMLGSRGVGQRKPILVCIRPQSFKRIDQRHIAI